MSELQAERERCEKCRWWESFQEDDQGRCHRYPPVYDTVVATEDFDTHVNEHGEAPSDASLDVAWNSYVWRFPVTTDCDYCGEFQKKGGIPRGAAP